MDLTGIVGRALPALDACAPEMVVGTLRLLLREALPVQDLAVYLVDYDQELLRELTDGTHHSPRIVDVEEGPLGEAFVSRTPVVVEDGHGGAVTHVPMVSRGERFGVLVVSTASPPPAFAVDELVRLGAVLALVVPRASLYCDHLERARRAVPLTLPAEIQWSELPVRAYSCDRFDVAGQLCPAYEVGGDVFDYTLEGNHLQVTALDAMGHGLGASLLGSLAINALRNNRRAGLSLVDQVRGADRVLYGQHGGDKFVCGAFVRLDTETGDVVAVNAGHPFGVLVRAGAGRPFDVPAQLPLGLFERTMYDEHRTRLEPGDRLVLVSDGVLEAAPPGGEEYGEERLVADLEALDGVGADETVRRVIRRLRHFEGVDLRDDITVIVLDWHGTG